MNTPRVIEAAAFSGLSQFGQEYMGLGSKSIRAHLLGDMLVVRLQGVSTAAGQHLVNTLAADKSRDLVKQVRSQLIGVARPRLDNVFEDTTGNKPSSLNHDISTLTSEEIVAFTLAEAPCYREVSKT